MGGDADILLRGAVITSPPPDLAEHAAVQLTQKIFVNDLSSDASKPTHRLRDVGLLGFVLLPACRNVGQTVLVALLVGEGCVCVVIAIE